MSTSLGFGPVAISIAGSPEVAGGEIGSISVPEEARLAGNPRVDPGEALNLSWKPTGSDIVVLSVVDNDLAYSCPLVDDGFFTVPAFVTAKFDDDVDVVISFNARVRSTEVNGRTVLLFGDPHRAPIEK